MQNDSYDSPAEVDVRFQGYRLDVIQTWPQSPRKEAVAEAISQRLASIGRTALVRPDITDLMHLSCRLLDDLFVASGGSPTHHENWRSEEQQHEPNFEISGVYS
jgi:hypothetical protein